MIRTWRDLDVAIPTVTSRSDLLGPLIAELGTNFPGASIRVEPQVAGKRPRARVSRLFGRVTGEVLLTIEDDVALSSRLRKAVRVGLRLLAAGPAVVSLYSPHDRSPGIYVETIPFHGALGLLMPATVASFIHTRAPGWYGRASNKRRRSAVDTMIGEVCAENRIPILGVYPSTIQHRIDIPSTFGSSRDDKRGRRSPTFKV